MTKNDSDGSAKKKQKGRCDLNFTHASSASFFENNSRHGDGCGTDQLVQNAIFGNNINKTVFGSDSLKLKQETRASRSKALSKKEIDFHLLMAHAFHGLTRKKSDQLSSLLGVIVKSCMDTSFHDKFQIKRCTQNHII